MQMENTTSKSVQFSSSLIHINYIILSAFHKINMQVQLFSLLLSLLDKLTEYDLHMSRGLFVGICLIVLVVGLVVGTVSTLLICHIQRRKTKTSKYIVH